MNFPLGRPGAAAVLLLTAPCVGAPAPAQEVFTYKTETHLIDTAVSVHTSAGGLVQGLSAADFHIVEDGVPQTVRFFAHDTDARACYDVCTLLESLLRWFRCSAWMDDRAWRA